MKEFKHKIRAWYKPDFKTEDGPLKFILDKIEDELFLVMEKDSLFYYEIGIAFQDEDWITELFTGIKDKNNIDIYQGDILKYEVDSPDGEKSYVGEVYYDDEFAVFLFDRKFENSFMDFRIKKKSLEVIGNIYENPDLLK